MKLCFFAALALLSVPGMAQDGDRAMARAIFSQQINQHAAGLKATLQDADREIPVSSISSSECTTTIKAGSRQWVVNWKESDGIEIADPSFFIVYGADRPLFALAVDSKDQAQIAKLSNMAKSIDHLWNNCE